MVLNVTTTHQEKNYKINKHHFFLWKIKVGFMYTRKCVRCSTLCLLLWHVLTDRSPSYRNIYRKPEEVLPWCSEDVSHTYLLSTKKKKKNHCRTHLVQDLITLHCVAILLQLPQDSSIHVLHTRVA